MKILVIITFLVTSLASFSQSEIECSKFKTGVFEIDNLDGTVSTIRRTKKNQIEKSIHFTGKYNLNF